MVRTPRAVLPILAAALLAACGSSRKVEDSGEGGHPDSFADPAVHGPAAVADLGSCQICHGADYGGGLGPSCNACHQDAGYPSWTSNCTFCHYNEKVQVYTPADLPKAAPPTASPAAPNNGHLFHVGIGVGCETCHPGTTATSAGPNHLNGVKEYTDLTGTQRTDGWNGVPEGQGTGICAACHTGG